jgi:hypothetical protein
MVGPLKLCGAKVMQIFVSKYRSTVFNMTTIRLTAEGHIGGVCIYMYTQNTRGLMS